MSTSTCGFIFILFSIIIYIYVRDVILKNVLFVTLHKCIKMRYVHLWINLYNIIKILYEAFNLEFDRNVIKNINESVNFPISAAVSYMYISYSHQFTRTDTMTSNCFYCRNDNVKLWRYRDAFSRERNYIYCW